MSSSPHAYEALLALVRRFDPDALVTNVTGLGEEWADKDAAASTFEESRKSVLASLILEYGAATSAPGGKTVRAMPAIQAEQRALCDPRYETHLELMVAARKQANVARVRYDLGKMRLELMRSQMATIRQELKSLPGL